MNLRKSYPTAHKITLSAILAALALIFSYIEALIPLQLAVPGIKLGIANLVVIVSLYTLGFGCTLAINVVRILVAGLLFSGMFGAVYSLAGGLLSLLIMYLLMKTKLFSVTGVSMAGGVAHNLGQLFMAALLISNIKVFVYFPVLMFSGMICGTIIGLVSHLILRLLSSAAEI